MKDLNEVILEGTIVHKFVTDQIAILTINTGSATPTPNNPKVLFFGDIRKDIEDNYEVKDHVKVIGNIQSSRRKPNVANQNTLAVFGESIEKAKTVMEQEFGVVSQKSNYTYTNTFKVCGELVSIELAYTNLLKVKILTNKNNRISYVTLVYYTNQPGTILNACTPGDTVCAIGCVQTTKKTTNGETKHFENYVASEILKA